MKQQGPIDILFLMRENSKIEISLNNHHADFETILACNKALNDFVSDLTMEDIADYNSSVDQWIEEDNKKINESFSKGKEPIPGYIYIYKTKDLYKIGRSKDKDCRKRRYTTENPYPIKLVLRFKSDDYIKTETEIHRALAYKRHRGEWFKLDEEDIKVIKYTYA